MAPANYTITVQVSSASNKFDSQKVDLEVPDWYFDDGDELVVGEPDASNDVLRLLLNKLGIEHSNVVYWNIAPLD